MGMEIDKGLISDIFQHTTLTRHEEKIAQPIKNSVRENGKNKKNDKVHTLLTRQRRIDASADHIDDAFVYKRCYDIGNKYCNTIKQKI